MAKIRVVYLCLGLIVAANPVLGQEVTLAEALTLFADNNLELQDARMRAAEMSGLAQQAAAYPNPSAMLTHEPVWNDGDSYSETYLNLSQRLEWPGLRRARIEAADQLARAAHANFAADSLRLVHDVVDAYVRAVAAERRREVLSAGTELFREADRANQERGAEGEVSGYRMRRLRVERARYESRLTQAALEVDDAGRNLALLVAPESTNVTPIDGFREIPRDIQLTGALVQARQNRSELIRAHADVDAAQAALDLAYLGRRPEPHVTAGFKRQSNGYNGLFLGTSLPLPLFDRNEGTIAARQAGLQAAQRRQALTEARVEHDVRVAHARYASISERVQLISEGLLSDADGLLHAARVGYDEGEMSLVELLDAAEAYSDARESTLDLTANLHIAYYDLVRSVGGRLGDATFTAAN